jgi:hypothetical protein
MNDTPCGAASLFAILIASLGGLAEQPVFPWPVHCLALPGIDSPSERSTENLIRQGSRSTSAGNAAKGPSNSTGPLVGS